MHLNVLLVQLDLILLLPQANVPHVQQVISKSIALLVTNALQEPPLLAEHQAVVLNANQD